MSTLTDYGYAYDAASTIEKVAGGSAIGLQHSAELPEVAAVPTFFWGRLREPYLTAKCLSTIAKTVRSRFALTAQQLAALRDPIVTAGAETVRFEGFSSCNGVYARLDLLPESLDGEFPAAGTTNVDFNEPMIHALNGIARGEDVTLVVGTGAVTIITQNGKAVEKKVALPQRWIKGLTSVQHYLAEMEEKLVLTRAGAAQLFASLPKSTVKADLFIVQRGGKSMFSPVGSAGGVRVGGAHRLRLLEGLLPFMDALHVYTVPDGQAAGFIAVLGNLQLLMAFSADAYRGFSGEGKALEYLAGELPLEWIHGVNSLLTANETFDPTMLALEHDLNFGTADAITAALSSIGLLGYDVTEGRHFFRRLPFKTERILSLNPRLKAARKLVSDNDIIFNERRTGYTEARVRGSGDVHHTVVIEDGRARCTCEWHTRHQGERGMCKHILAVRMRADVA